MPNIQNIQIIDYEDKVSQFGPYTVFNTNKGPLGSFIPETIKDLKENKGNVVNVGLEQKGEYTNIIEFLGVVETLKSEVENVKVNQPKGNSYLSTEEIAFVRKLKKAFE